MKNEIYAGSLVRIRKFNDYEVSVTKMLDQLKLDAASEELYRKYYRAAKKLPGKVKKVEYVNGSHIFIRSEGLLLCLTKRDVEAASVNESYESDIRNAIRYVCQYWSGDPFELRQSPSKSAKIVRKIAKKELDTYEQKRKELEKKLKALDIQIGNTIIKKLRSMI